MTPKQLRPFHFDLFFERVSVFQERTVYAPRHGNVEDKKSFTRSEKTGNAQQNGPEIFFSDPFFLKEIVRGCSILFCYVSKKY